MAKRNVQAIRNSETPAQQEDQSQEQAQEAHPEQVQENTLQDDAGKVAYEAYFKHSNGVSLVSGSTLPVWEHQRPEIQSAWQAAAQAVIDFDYNKNRE